MQYVYVAKAGDFSKIGIAKNPRVRVHGLAIKPARLVYVLECARPRDVEQFALLTVHEVTVGGEYLRCKPKLAIAAIKYAAVEICGRYVTILDAEPDRWLVDNAHEPNLALLAGLRALSP